LENSEETIVGRACPEPAERECPTHTQPNHTNKPRQSRPPTNRHLPTKRRGELAEAAFLYKAASLGFSISKPWGESDRYDFILDSGSNCWRVQVKSAHCDGKNGYSFHACGNVQSQTYTAKDIDFLVAYIAPEDVWYVLPIGLFSAIRSVKFFPSSKRRMSRFEKYRDAWHYFGTPKTPKPNADAK
jgi:PD-(D/E)XK endonuclease